MRDLSGEPRWVREVKSSRGRRRRLMENCELARFQQKKYEPRVVAFSASLGAVV